MRANRLPTRFSTRLPATPPRAGAGPRLHHLAQALAGAFLLSQGLVLPALAQAPVAPLPQGLLVRQGQAQLQTQGTQMTVRNTPNAILDWQSFSIAAGHGVHFEQLNAQSKVLNRVTGGEPSQILGSLSSNGQVWLINPSGVLFGRDARVDVSSLLVSTLQLGDADFLAGRYLFRQDPGPSASLVNQGQLRSAYGGQIALLGGRVENSGSVDTPGGSQLLATARSLELVDTGLPNLSLRLDVPAGELLNLGELSAADGRIDVHAAVVNQQGLIRANRIERNAQGQISLRASEALNLSAGSRTEADGPSGGRIELNAGPAGTALLQGQVSATGHSGKGGQVSVLGQQLGLLDGAQIDVSGSQGGGEIFIGGGLQGQDTRFANARASFMAPGAELRADAGARGDGGRIIVWSDEATRAFGRFSARGGSEGGQGGFVETSGGWLDARPAALDLSAARGASGQWLLDPNDIRIGNTVPDSNAGSAPNFSSSDTNSTLSTATIAAALNAGTSVTISTGSGGSNLQKGSVNFVDALLQVAPPTAVTLTINSQDYTQFLNTTIRSSASPLNLVVRAAGNGSNGNVIISGSTFSTRGGNVTLGGTQLKAVDWPSGQGAPTLYAMALGASDRQGVMISDSRLLLGTGNLSAFGSGGTAGVSIGGSDIQGGVLSLVGSATGTDAPGIEIYGNSALSASLGMRLEGGGAGFGVRVDNGSRLILNSSVQGASLSILGQGREVGVSIIDKSPTAGAGFGSTPIRVIGGSLDVTGESLAGGAGLLIFSEGGVGAPAATTLDLSQASGATLVSRGDGALGLQIRQARILGPSSGGGLFIRNESTSPLPGAGGTSLDQVVLTQGGGLAQVEGQQLSITSSQLQADRLFLLSRPGTSAAGGTVISVRGSSLDASLGDVFIGGSNGSTPTASGTGMGVELADAVLHAKTSIFVDGQADNNWGVLSMRNQFTADQGSIQIQGQAPSSGAVYLLDSDLRAPSISVQGKGRVAINGAGRPILLQADTIKLSATTPAGALQPATLEVIQASSLDASGTMTLESDHGLVITPFANGIGPKLKAGDRLTLQINSAAGMQLGGANDNVSASSWEQAFSSMPSTARVRVRSGSDDNSPMRIDVPIALGSKLDLSAGTVTLGAAGRLSSSASGDAIGLTARNLVNQAGATALQTPNGRWLMVLNEPLTTNLGALINDWTQYGIGKPQLATLPKDAAGNLITELPGSGVFFAPTVASLLNGASSGFVFSKQADGNVNMPLDLQGLTGASKQITGLLPGHGLLSSANAQFQFADAAAGSNKVLTPAAGTTVRVVDANAKPVLGYGPLSFTGSIVAAPAPAPAPAPTSAPQAGLSGAIADQALFAADASLALLNPPSPASTPEEGRSLDATSAVAGNEGAPRFASLDLGRLSSLQQRSLLAARDEFKKQLFAASLHRLEQDPSLAEVRPCQTLDEVDSGQCLLTEALKREAQLARELRAARQHAAQQARLGQRRIKQASVPQIERKFAVLVGINAYSDARIPQLSSAAPDARAMSELLEQRFGYETVLVENASRSAIIQALNRVALEAGPRDSVVVYYAGHGMLSSETGMGYWLPADSRSDDPAHWLSNADIGRLSAQFGARQFLLVSDSCYSGSLAGAQAVAGDSPVGSDDAAAQALLQRKAAVVLSSGGNEPVADSGRDGHSIFAWHLMRSLESLPSWRGGQQVYQKVRSEVLSSSFPQTPRYGAAGQLGHEAGSDYVFERRELEAAATPGVERRP